MALLCSLLGVDASTAAAYYSTHGTGTGSTPVGNIVGPSGVSATQSGTNVTVSWTAATLSSGAAVQGYVVTRSGGAVICGSPTLVTALSCTDSAVPSGTYTYAVKAVYNTWDATATSSALTILTAPTITSKPPNPNNSTSASFGLSGGNGTSYQCQLDSGAFTICTSPASYSALSQGSHTFTTQAASGSSTGPSVSYTWTVDTVAPTQSVALASGATGAYLTGTTLYYRGAAAGSFKLVDTVSDSGTGPASALYPSIGTTGWTHASESVTTPSGGPYTSSLFSWTANPSAPASYSVTAADVAGNTTSTPLTLTNDSTAPTGGAVTVNGTAATAAGSTSQATNSTNFAIGSRTDYTDGGSGLKSSLLTVQSQSLSVAGICGAAAGPFSSVTTITGTTQPSGIVAGYCYVYTLTGTDNVGNVASVKTTVIDNAVSFNVASQPTTASAGTPISVTLTAIKNGATDTSYTGAALTWSGAANSPSGTTPTLPTNPTWAAGVATFTITLVDAQTATLTVTDGTRSATLGAITVTTGVASNIAWTSPSSTPPAPATCLFTCNFGAGFGNGNTWSAYLSITDSQGNIINNLGTSQTVTLSINGKPSLTPSSVTIPATGAATSSVPAQYASVTHGSFTDTLTASDAPYTSATASFAR